MAFSHISRTKYASAILSQGWAITYKLPEARSPKASGTCCHPGSAPISPRSLPKHGTLFIALVLHTWLLLRPHLHLSRDRKPLTLWGALVSPFHNNQWKSVWHDKATFLLTASLLASQLCFCWAAWPHHSQLELCPR